LHYFDSGRSRDTRLARQLGDKLRDAPAGFSQALFAEGKGQAHKALRRFAKRSVKYQILINRF
ncbi:hypothetical protein, partial [Klebsiella pneumoniae]|uniref:hypothetical protein n=1 Tax=Klebsiella pneumoniae TaxID=573 RepID=UPI0039C0F97D